MDETFALKKWRRRRRRRRMRRRKIASYLQEENKSFSLLLSGCFFLLVYDGVDKILRNGGHPPFRNVGAVSHKLAFSA